jgi:hypothetical protein
MVFHRARELAAAAAAAKVTSRAEARKALADRQRAVVAAVKADMSVSALTASTSSKRSAADTLASAQPATQKKRKTAGSGSATASSEAPSLSKEDCLGVYPVPYVPTAARMTKGKVLAAATAAGSGTGAASSPPRCAF